MKITINKITYDLILFGVAGSRLYGTYYDKGDNPLDPTYESDYDYRGIFIAPSDTKVGLNGNIEQLMQSKSLIDELNLKLNLELKYDDDIVLYEIKKFVKLALNNNPNIMDILFSNLEPLYINDKGKVLHTHRNLFISSKMKFTFSGYAFAQLKKMKSHNKWMSKFPKYKDVIKILLKALKEKTINKDFIEKNFSGDLAKFIYKKYDIYDCNLNNISRKDFIELYDFKDLIEYMKPTDKRFIKFINLDSTKFELNDLNDISKVRLANNLYSIFYHVDSNIFDKFDFLIQNESEKKINVIDDFICLCSIDLVNRKKKRDYLKNYWNWVCNRNEKRSLLELNFGYDTKHASHLVRLMLGVTHILNGEIYNPTLNSDDLKFVMDVRNGKYSYNDIIDYSKEMDNKLNELYKTTKIRKKPKLNDINKILIELSKD